MTTSPAIPSEQRGSSRSAVLIAVVSACLRLVIAWLPLDLLDRHVLVDDSYIAFNVSRSLGLGHGPLGDSIHATSGYQPLFVWLMAPGFGLCGQDRVLPIHLALSFLALCGALTGYLLYRLVRTIAGQTAGLVALLFWSFSPQTVQIGMNGLETSLSSLMLIGCLTVAARLNEKGSPSHGRHELTLGALWGLATLARIDNVLLALVLVPWLAPMALREGRFVRRFVAVGVGWAGLVAPWALMNVLYSGSPFPESGAGTRFQTMLTGEGGVMPFSAWLVRNLGVALSSWVVRLHLLLAAGLLAALSRPATPASYRRTTAPLLVLVAHASVLIVFYCGWVGAYWYFYRYFYPVRLAVSATAAIAIVVLWDRVGGRVRVAWAPIAVGATCVLAVVLGELPRALAPRLGGYREIGLWANDHLPPGSIVAAAQAGSLAYHASRLVVINIDGKTNGRALEALRARTMDAYLREERVRYVLDWEWNIRKMVVGRSAPGGLDLVLKEKIVTATNGEWSLYEIR